MDSIEQYIVRDVTGVTFPHGDTAAAIGYVMLELPDTSKREEGELASMATPAFTMASPAFSGLERLLKYLQLPVVMLKVRLDVEWLPATKEVMLSFRGTDRMQMEDMKPRLLMPPFTLHAAEQDKENKYGLARQYAFDNSMLLFQLLNSSTGVSQNTIFRKLSGDKNKAKYGRVETTSGKLTIT